MWFWTHRLHILAVAEMIVRSGKVRFGKVKFGKVRSGKVKFDLDASWNKDAQMVGKDFEGNVVQHVAQLHPAMAS